MLSGGSSQEAEFNALTPAKRPVPSVYNLEEYYDQNSLSKKSCSVRIKTEKSEKSG